LDRIKVTEKSQLIKKENYIDCEKKCIAISATGYGGPQVCETSRLPHFLGNWLTDGDEVVSLMHWPPFTPRMIPGTHF
jgi:hypothetical protein